MDILHRLQVKVKKQVKKKKRGKNPTCLMVGCDVIEVVKIEELKEALVFACTHLSGVMLLYLCDY